MNNLATLITLVVSFNVTHEPYQLYLYESADQIDEAARVRWMIDIRNGKEFKQWRTSYVNVENVKRSSLSVNA